MDVENIIKQDFKNNQITDIQFDLNGLCNAGCWFCPVAYQGNPSRTKNSISISLVEKVLQNISEEKSKNRLVSKDLSKIFTSHYNEILLYPHLEEFFKLLEKYHFKTNIFTNGTPLTPKTTNLLLRYKNIIQDIVFNIPVFSNDELWAKRTNMNKKIFPKLIRNIKYAYDKLLLKNNIPLLFFVNGVSNKEIYTQGGIITPNKDFPQDINLDPSKGEHAKEIKLAKEIFPKAQVSLHNVMDRAGALNNVFTNQPSIDDFINFNNLNKKVIGCDDLTSIKKGGRPFNFLHINSLGEAFLCCNDFNMDYIFGDFKTQKLQDFWGKDFHISKIKEAYKGICTKCIHAKFNKKL